MKNVRWCVALAMLALAGCSNGVDEAQEAAARQEEAEAAARAAEDARALAILNEQKACITAAANNTFLTLQSDNDFAASFERQDLTRCPTDFTQRFVALGNSVRLYVSTMRDLAVHEGRRDDAAISGIMVTARDLYQGTPSNDSPMTDWVTEGSDLQRRAATLRREIEDSIAGIKVNMARYGLTVQTNPPVDAAAPATNVTDGYSAATK